MIGNFSGSLELQPVISQTQPGSFVTNCRFSPSVVVNADLCPSIVSSCGLTNQQRHRAGWDRGNSS